MVSGVIVSFSTVVVKAEGEGIISSKSWKEVNCSSNCILSQTIVQERGGNKDIFRKIKAERLNLLSKPTKTTI